MLTLLRSDLFALRDILNCIRAQISLVHTNIMNIILKPNPITVITKFVPEDIIFTLFCYCCCLLYPKNPSSPILFWNSPLSLLFLLIIWVPHNCKYQKISNLALFITPKRSPSNNLRIKTRERLEKTASWNNYYTILFSFSHSKKFNLYQVSTL